MRIDWGFEVELVTKKGSGEVSVVVDGRRGYLIRRKELKSEMVARR